MSSDQTRQIIKGYELQERLGAGGFGAVYRALQPAIGREVAIKVILPEYANEADFIRRFDTEARLVARMEHPHIVPLFDYWRDPEGAYLVMRFLRGGSLRQVVEQGLLPPETVVKIIEQIASALALAHRNDIIHRDIKPHNIMLDEDGNAYLTDFGIARAANATLAGEDEFSMSGTPAYISPEQIMNTNLSPRSDLYSLGIVIYEMLAGQHPFPESSLAQLIYKQANEPLPDIGEIADVPQAVNLVIQRATAKNPEDRYPDALILAAELRESLFGANYTPETEPYLPELVNPYKGLRPFEEADSADFFGRDNLTTQLLERLSESSIPGQHTQTSDYLARFLAVVGPSGGGKSSVVNAGLIPKLRHGALSGSENWFIVRMVPGPKPVENLAGALLSVALKPPSNLLNNLLADSQYLASTLPQILGAGQDELLLVIDQFEEVFTLNTNEDEQAHFLDLLDNTLRAPQTRLRLLITLRADYYDRPLFHEGFGHLMQTRTQLVLPMSGTEIEQAITGPAARVGLHIEPEFLAAIIADIRDEPGALPLLQYALTEIYEHREARALTLASYRLAGGVLGALSRRAEEVYSHLDTPAQTITRQLFLRLVTPDEGSTATRRRAHRAELLGLGDAVRVDAVLDAFGKYRLLTFDREIGTREPLVEIAHEALMREWQRLQTWLDESREDIRTERWLATAAKEWFDSGCDSSYLVRGARLEQLEQWVEETDLQLTGDERAYLTASLNERQLQDELEHERQRKELELAQEAARQAQEAARAQAAAANRLRALAVVLLGAFAIAIALSFFAFDQRGKAQSSAATAIAAQGQARVEADNAKRKAEEVQSLALSFNALLESNKGNSDLALALAMQAAQIPNPPSQVRSILVETAYAPGTKRIFSGHQAEVMSLALLPDGRTMLSGVGRYTVTQDLAADNSIILWNLDTGDIIRRFEGHTDTVWDIAVSADGKTFLSASSDTTVRLWDINSGTEIGQFTGHTQDVRSVTISPDGKTALSGGGRFTSAEGNSEFVIRLWDIASRTEICQMHGHTSEIRVVQFSPDGRYALSASGAELSGLGDNSIRLWDVATCTEIRQFPPTNNNAERHDDIVQDVAFSPDGKTFLSASADSTLILWDVETGQLLQRYEGHSDWVNKVAFSPDGRNAISGSWDNTVILWDVAAGTIVNRFVGHTSPVSALSFTTDGNSFVSASHDTTLRQWTIETPLFIRRLGETEDDFARVALFSPDQLNVLAGGGDGIITLWDIATGWATARYAGHDDEVNTLAFAPDGKTFLSGSSDGKVLLWDVGNHQIIHELSGHDGRIWSLAFSPDGLWAASGSDDSRVILWNITTGQEFHRFEGDISEVYGLTFTPDNKWLIAGTSDPAIVIWDIETGAEVHRLLGHTGAVQVLRVSQDGQYLLSGGYDNRIILWDLSTGAEVRRYEGHYGTIVGLNFQPDGQSFLSAAYDQTVRIWDINGDELGRVDVHGNLSNMALRTDGQVILLADFSQPMTLNHLPLTDVEPLLAWTKANRYLYELTCSERALYNVEPLCGTR